MSNLIPKPATLNAATGEFALSHTTKIVASSANAETFAIAKLLADNIEQHVKFKLAVMDEDQSPGNIHLQLNDDASLGEEGYELSIQTDGIWINAYCPAGLFYGVQTLRQILSAQQTTLSLPAVSIADSPR